MTIVTKNLNDIQAMTKEEADYLREIFKDDDDIDFSDIPELDDETLATGKTITSFKVTDAVAQKKLMVNHHS